jgi:hypothetical protein
MPRPIVFTDMRERARLVAPPRDQDKPKEAKLAEEALDKALDRLGLSNDEKNKLERDLNQALKDVEKNNPREAQGLYPISFSGENDPLFRVTRNKLASMKVGVDPSLTHVAGRLDSQRSGEPPARLTDAEILLSAVYGILERSNDVKPEADRFGNAVTAAFTEYRDHQALFDATFDVLLAAGTPKRGVEGDRQVSAQQWATVVRRLREQGITANDPHVDEVATGILVGLRSADTSLSAAGIIIDVPSLEDVASIEILEPNLHATQGIYFASMLEEMKVFQVMDKLIEQFHGGTLPLGKGRAGELLYRYWKDSDERLTELERRNLYERAFGFPGGEAQSAPNREFNDLWLRFVSAVSSYQRQLTVDSLLRANIPSAISQEQVRKAGRDLAGNLSLHGYGSAIFIAKELQDQTEEILELFKDSEIQNAYGARDIWQVVEQVAALELGGAKNTFRYRTMAVSGAVIIRWLADRSRILASSSLQRVLEPDVIKNQQTSPKPTTSPTDFDLVNACEQWLAVTGTPETRVEEYAQPSEPPMQTSRPIQIPQAARDLLESVGVSAGLGYGGRRNGNGKPALAQK